MTTPLLRALSESGASHDDPSEELLFDLLAEVEAGEGTFLIVERAADPSGQTYAQALRHDDGSYLVEYRAGGPKRHFQTQAADVRAAHRLLTGWAFGVPGWDTAYEWTQVGL